MWLSNLVSGKAALVECHIPGQLNRVGILISELVSFRTRLIPNKHDLNGLHIQLATLVSGYMHVPLASKDMQV